MTLTFSDLCARFSKWAGACLHPTTVAVYQHYFRLFRAHHGDMPVTELQPAHLTEWADNWHSCQALKRLFNWATDDACIVERNPFRRVKHPPRGQRRRVLNRRECARLLRRLSPDLRTLLIAYRETFARPGEMRAACWEDVKSVTPRRTPRQALATGQAVIVLQEYKCRRRRRDATTPRVILLSPRMCRLLLRLMTRTRKRTGPIFRTHAGAGWSANALRCRFRRLRRRLRLRRDKWGESIVPYTFRHTGATDAAAMGVRDRALADVLGHVETKTTARYQHLCIEQLWDAMQKVWRRPVPDQGDDNGAASHHAGRRRRNARQL